MYPSRKSRNDFVRAIDLRVGQTQYNEVAYGIVKANMGKQVRVKIMERSGLFLADLANGVEVETGDSVLLERASKQSRWIVTSQYGAQSSAAWKEYRADEITAPETVNTIPFSQGIVVTWIAPVYSAVSYQVQISDEPDDTSATIVTVDGSVYVWEGTGTKYFRVRTVNTDGNVSGWSLWVYDTAGTAAGGQPHIVMDDDETVYANRDYLQFTGAVTVVDNEALDRTIVRILTGNASDLTITEDFGDGLLNNCYETGEGYLGPSDLGLIENNFTVEPDIELASGNFDTDYGYISWEDYAIFMRESNLDNLSAPTDVGPPYQAVDLGLSTTTQTPRIRFTFKWTRNYNYTSAGSFAYIFFGPDDAASPHARIGIVVTSDKSWGIEDGQIKITPFVMLEPGTSRDDNATEYKTTTGWKSLAAGTEYEIELWLDSGDDKLHATLDGADEQETASAVASLAAYNQTWTTLYKSVGGYATAAPEVYTEFYVDDFAIITTSGAATRVSPAYSLAEALTAKRLVWTTSVSEPGGSSTEASYRLSTDNGLTWGSWQAVPTSETEHVISGIGPNTDVAGYYMQTKQVLNVVGDDDPYFLSSVITVETSSDNIIRAIISDIVLSADASEVEFDIPAGYDDLEIRTEGRGDYSGGTDTVWADIIINDDTTASNYAALQEVISVAGSVMSTGEIATTPFPEEANSRAFSEIKLPNYLSSSHKMVMVDSAMTISGWPRKDRTTCVWKDTSQITGVKLQTSSGHLMAAGSRITIYGVKYRG